MTRTEKYRYLREKLFEESEAIRREYSKKLFDSIYHEDEREYTLDDMFDNPIQQLDDLMNIPKKYIAGGKL